MSDGAVKACGCGPLEPCAPHRDAGDLPDWEGRARAAEAKLAAVEEECRDHAELAKLGAASPPETIVRAANILAIIGSEEAPDGR